MALIKILFLDLIHPILKEKLEFAGFICDYKPGLSRNQILEDLKSYDGIVIPHELKIDRNFIDNSPNLKFIACSGAEYENIDATYAQECGIKYFKSPEGNRDAVGEHTLGLLLALMNNICIANQEVKKGIWNIEKNQGYEIKGKTVAIIGYGNMGNAFARRLRGFDCKVIAYDPYKFDYTDRYCRETTMQEIYERADIVSLQLPLYNETEFLIDHKYLSNFKKPIFLINTSRADLIVTKDLVENLKSGKILGAALEVTELEVKSDEGKISEPFQQLIQNDKVILTPKIAGLSKESQVKLADVLSDKIIANFGDITFL